MNAQGGKQNMGILSVRVVDQQSGQPIEYASFRLLNSSDSTVRTGAYSDVNGKVAIENIPFGKYFGVISYTAYTNDTILGIELSTDIPSANLGTVKIKLDNSLNLDEIKVVGTLDVLKAGIDKKVYNVGEDLSVRGGSANDVLNNIPSVEVDQEGNIMLRGNGTVTVLIDGRPSSLSGGNGKTLLDALPAGSIERIEVVTNPSAKYDPDGTLGIINIVLKKNKLKGINGMFSLNAGSGNFDGGNTIDGSASLSYRNAKVNLFGTYSGNYLEGYRNNYSDVEQIFSDGSVLIIDQNRVGTDLNAGQTLNMGADFYIKPRNVLGFTMTGSLGQRDRTGDQWNRTSDGNANGLQLWNRYSFDPSSRKNLDLNLNYKHDFKEDRGDLIFDVNQSLGEENIEGYYLQEYFSLDTVSLGQPVIDQRLNNFETNNITTAQTDFTYLFPKIASRMEAGAKMIMRTQSVDTYSESRTSSADPYLEDTLANFIYNYDERIYSAYGIFGQERGKWKYQGGLRLEKAYQIPDLVSDSIRIVNDYFNLFPSAHIRYALKAKNELSLSYSRRISRAGADQLNPFTSYADPYNLRRGNPYLQPEFIDSYDLGYSLEKKKLTLTTSIFYRYTTGVITRVKLFYEDNTSAMTFNNINKSHSTGFEAVVVYKPFTWWRNTISGNVNYMQYVDEGNELLFNTQSYNWSIKYSGSVDLWKKTAILQLNYNYNAPRITIQGMAQRKGALNLSGEKKFKDGKISLGFRVTDIFNRQGFYLKIDQPSIYQESTFKWLTRRYYITFTYKFGKLEMSKSKGGAGGDGGFDM